MRDTGVPPPLTTRQRFRQRTLFAIHAGRSRFREVLVERLLGRRDVSLAMRTLAKWASGKVAADSSALPQA